MCVSTTMLVRNTSGGSTSDASPSSCQKKLKLIARKKNVATKYSRPGSCSSGIVLQDKTTAGDTNDKQLNQGRWTKCERIAFLRGLRLFGKSKWKEISAMILTRDTTQTKTHAQTVMKLLAGGQNIFAELDLVESRRFFPEDDNEEKEEEEPRDEERKLVLLKADNNAELTSPTFTWKPEDFESAKALIMLKGSVKRL